MMRVCFVEVNALDIELPITLFQLLFFIAHLEVSIYIDWHLDKHTLLWWPPTDPRERILQDINQLRIYYLDRSMEEPESKVPAASTFADLGLDPRLLLALEKRQYEKPTTVQVTQKSSRSCLFLHVSTSAKASIYQGGETGITVTVCCRQPAYQRPWRART